MARRLLFPALYKLDADGKLDDLRVVGYALENWDTHHFRAQVRAGISELAGIENDREVLFVWERPNHPAATASAEALAVEAPTKPVTTP